MSEQETLGALMSKLSDGSHVVSFGDYIIDEIVNLLNINMGIKDDELLFWWLFEGVEKVIWVCDEKIEVKTLDQLYDYIIKYENQ